MKKPVIGYFRLSTSEQAQTNASRNQEARLKDAGAEEIYYDIESGANPDRPGFNQVLQLVAEGKVSQVIATRLDRLVRDPLIYEHLKEIFRGSGVELYLIDGGLVDLQSASGELCADLLSIFAVHERRSIIERVKKGQQKRRDRGDAWVRPPWGYVIVDERYRPDSTPMGWCRLADRPSNYLDLYAEPDASAHLIQTTKAQFAREIFEVVLNTRSPTKALNYLRQIYNVQRNSELVPPQLQSFPISEQGFKVWLRNPIFCGHTAYLKYGSGKGRKLRPEEEWYIMPNTHEAIISEDIANEIRDILATNRKKRTSSEKTAYLTGLIICSSCNEKCSLKGGGNKKYYGCKHASTVCNNRGNVNLPQIDQAIIRALTRKAWQFAQRGSAKSDALIALEEQYQQLLAIKDLNSNPALKAAQEDLRQQIEQLSLQTDQLCQSMLMHPQARKINFWYTLTQEDRLIFYEKLVSRVEIQDRHVSAVLLNV